MGGKRVLPGFLWLSLFSVLAAPDLGARETALLHITLAKSVPEDKTRVSGDLDEIRLHFSGVPNSPR